MSDRTETEFSEEGATLRAEISEIRDRFFETLSLKVNKLAESTTALKNKSECQHSLEASIAPLQEQEVKREEDSSFCPLTQENESSKNIPGMMPGSGVNDSENLENKSSNYPKYKKKKKKKKSVCKYRSP